MPHTDFKSLYEQQFSIVNEQQKLIELYRISIANHLTIEAKHQEANELQSQKIHLLQLQILELQKFIFSGRQEKFKPAAGSNELQTVLFENDKLDEAVAQSIQQVKGYEKNRTVIRVNHPGRKPLPAHLRREEIILTPTEDVTGLQPVGEEITEILEYQQGELYVKKYIRPEYIKPAANGTQAKRVIAALPNMPIAKNYVGASLLAHLMASKYTDHLPVYRRCKCLAAKK